MYHPVQVMEEHQGYMTRLSRRETEELEEFYDLVINNSIKAVKEMRIA